MRRWIRIATITVATAAALAFGLSAASAGASGTTPPPAPPIPDGNHVINPQVVQPAGSESLFTPITPCRIVDTRSGGGILANNTPRSFYVTGTAGFASQGGTAGGCGIPADATGITTNVTTVGTALDGYLTGYPTGSIPPETNFITTHKNFNLTANPTFALTAGHAKPLTITNHGGNTHVIIDVTGYHLPQITAVLNYDGADTSPDGVFRSGGVRYASPRVISSVRISTGNYRVTLDRDLTGCTPIAAVYGPPLVASANAVDNSVFASIHTLDGVQSDQCDELHHHPQEFQPNRQPHLRPGRRQRDAAHRHQPRGQHPPHRRCDRLLQTADSSDSDV